MASPRFICPSLSVISELAEARHAGEATQEVTEYMLLFDRHQESCEACSAYFKAATQLIAARESAVEVTLKMAEGHVAAALADDA